METEKNRNKSMIAMFFDTEKIDDCFYGDIVFGNFLEGKEIVNNAFKTVFSVGDIINHQIRDALNPFIIKDEFCTVDNKNTYNGNIYVFLIEDIEMQIAKKIDTRLHSTFSAYIGMTTIDINSCDTRKQFWKDLIRRFSIERNILTCFGDNNDGEFSYYDTANEKGFAVKYDGFSCNDFVNEYDEFPSTRQSSFIQSESQLELKKGTNDSDRAIMEMNFSLVKELQIAGTQIWKAIEDINRVYISKKDDNFNSYIFTSLYQAAQGIERLFKIALELFNYKNNNHSEKEKIESLLYSHNHCAINNYLSKKCHFNFDKDCKRLLDILNRFYAVARYSRYKYNSCDSLELELLLEFGKKINAEDYDFHLKKLYGACLSKIAQGLYDLIESLSHDLNIYTYEFDHNSIVSYVFSTYYGDNLYSTLKKTEISKKELLLYLIKKGNTLPFSDFLYDIPSLDFENCDISEYIYELIVNENGSTFLNDFVSCSYEDLVNENNMFLDTRIEAIDNLIGNTNICFDEEI